jgi:exoribonuclease-2
VDELLDSQLDGKTTDRTAEVAHRFTSKQAQTLMKLFSWAELRKQYRGESGGLHIHLPKVEAKVDKETGKITLKMQDPLRRSQILVSEMMILAGEVAAFHATKYDLFLPFRVQSGKGDEGNPSGEEESDSTKVLLNAYFRIRGIQKAKNEVVGSVHHSIGLKRYCRTTSPIRRYMDILTHFQLKSHLRGEELAFSPNV